MTTFKTIDHKFTIIDESKEVDCYLIVGFLDENNKPDFQHLSIGEICFIDLKVSIKTDEAKGLEIAFNIIREYIKDGGRIDTAIKVLMYQRTHPLSVMHDDQTSLRGSICDYIGRYLDRLSSPTQYTNNDS